MSEALAPIKARKPNAAVWRLGAVQQKCKIEGRPVLPWSAD